MSNVEKLKKKAAEFEQKKQFDRALEVYLQIIGATEGQEEKDVTVYNRVGDLYLRLNKTDQAVNYYEQAVDLYADGGYLNNAIALCNKILRHAPARHIIYYKLGKISAKKGFNSDAKKNFLEYADRMHRSGRDTDAFKALQEFADLCPGQDDIRLMLADQLAKAGKTAEAVEQLQILHESLDAEGRTAEAEATVQRMQALQPGVEPRRSNSPREKDAGGLIFLDVGGSPPKPRPKISGLQPTSMMPEREARPKTPPHVQPAPEFEGLPDLETIELGDPEPEPLQVERTSEPEMEMPPLEIQTNAESVADSEPAFDLSVSDIEIAPLEGLESAADPMAFAITEEASARAPEPEPEPEQIEGLQTSEGITSMDPGLGEPLSDQDPLAGLSLLEDDRFYVEDSDPLAGLGQTPEPIPERPAAPARSVTPPAAVKAATPPAPVASHPAPQQAARPTPRAAESATEPVELEPVELEEETTPEVVARAHAAEPELDETEPEEEEVEEGEAEPSPPPREAPAIRSVKPTRPKLVSPVRPTRPRKTPSKKKTPSEQEAAEERRPVNPFMRQKQQPQKLKPRDPSPKASPKVATPPAEAPRAAAPKQDPPPRSHDDNFVNLSDWLRDDSHRSTRMIADDNREYGEGEQADWKEMLEKFKQGVAANVDDEDFDSHYDLGIAYKEMGLIDEAIAEFQKALRGAAYRIRAYEALGQCFIDRHEFDVAMTVLSRALREPGMEDEDLIGVLYLLGNAAEESRKPRDAAAYYQRVFAVDIDFRDVSKRLKQMSKAASK